MIDVLLARGYISSAARRRVGHLFEKTPWLYQAPVGKQWPVRHNLDKSFLEQLQEAVAGETVHELWVLCPFYDRGMVALERMLDAINPRRATLLMQASRTSVDPTELKSILHRIPGHCRVRSFSLGTDSPYVHAKLYLLKLSSRAICLQGSPNLTQTAMLMTAQRGNIEITNLLTGDPDAFDHLLDPLEIGAETTEIDGLDLSYQEAEEPEGEQYKGWRLTGGEWHDDRLDVAFEGSAPALDTASLLIAEREFPIDILRRQAKGLQLRLSSEASDLLGSPVAVRVRWVRGDEILVCNPIFVCNRAALSATLEVTDERKSLTRVGDLDLDDEEFEQLLAELDAVLMIDRRSVWRLAGRTPPSTQDEDDELHLDYLDVDYEVLRRHPKIRQYMRGALGAREYATSRLQLILNAITDHFQGLVSPRKRSPPSVIGITKAGADEAETAEDREEEAEAQERRRRTQIQRVGRLLKNFIRRYLRGIQSPDFQELMGYEVMANNYAIFSHILWRLFAKEWVEPEFIVDSLLRTWHFFWGSDGQPGYYWRLSREQEAQVLELLREYHTDAELLAATYYCAVLTRLGYWLDLRFRLRDFWRETMRRPPFDVTSALLEDAWSIVAHLIPYQPPFPSQIVDELAELARFTTRNRFLRTLEERHRFPQASCKFEKQPVYRKRLEGSDMVDCLVIDAGAALQDMDDAINLLRSWMQAEELEYYRLLNAVNGRVLYYDAHEHKGRYWAKDRREETVFDPVDPLPAAWTSQISRMRTIAEGVDDQLPAMLAERQAGVDQLQNGSVAVAIRNP